MSSPYSFSTKKAGLSPGSVVYVGKERDIPTKISVIDYGPDTYEEKTVDEVADCLVYKRKSTNSWINVEGLHEVDIITSFGEKFGIHPLVLEDIANTYQRPKMEEYDNYLFIVLKMLYYEEAQESLQVEQISLIVGPHYVISFQEQPGDVFNHVRQRIKSKGKRLIEGDSDYLAYALIDAIVDHYFSILEKFSDDIEDLEEELLEDPERETIEKIHRMKREVIALRRSVWPLREMLSQIGRSNNPFITQENQLFFRDVYDHTIQVLDTVESLRDIISGLIDLYLSSISNRMNEVMQVLTIIATIFIPLTWLAGIYGMNFSYMPELRWKWSYPAIMGVMLIIAVIMLLYFRKKEWL